MRVIWEASRAGHGSRRRGFTLIEASLTTLIVGVGILAMVQLFATCSRQNRDANQETTAMLLVGNIQETMNALPLVDPVYGSSHFGPEPGETLATYNDIDDFDGSSFNPPIDAERKPLPQLSQYTQVISVMPVYANQLDVNTNESAPSIVKGTYTGAVRVRVKILYRPAPALPAGEVYRASWIRVDK